jgi:hypothetical protein
MSTYQERAKQQEKHTVIHCIYFVKYQVVNTFKICVVSGSHSSDYEEYYLLGCNAI